MKKVDSHEKVPTSAFAAVEKAGAAADRYRPRKPQDLTVPRRPVTRKDYVDFIRPFVQDFGVRPFLIGHGPGQVLPALAVFAYDGDAELARRIKLALRRYGDWVQHEIRQNKGLLSLEGATISSWCFRELRKRNQMAAEDEKWAKELLLTLRQYECAWRPGDGLWRGSQHRSQAQGINHALAATFYPDEPDAPKWKAYADKAWSDWWDFRDVGINDIWYFSSSFGNIISAAELLGRAEVFTDPQARQLFDRILYEITPDGAVVPYGASCGYNATVGTRILALELAAKHTRDGRYRWGAHRLLNYVQARGLSTSYPHAPQANEGNIALASILCDDAVVPVEPDPGSKLLMRREIIRLTDRQAKQMFPEAGGVDCNMYMTQRLMPNKLVLRSGWNPGDMYMLVECYPRHDPLNPTAIVGFERWSAAFAEMTSEKFISRENAVHVQDLSGTATYLGSKDHRGPKQLALGWAGMEVAVPAFSDHKLATYARVRVSKYMGFEADHEREFLFVKNRFVLVRDETTFHDAFLAKAGPVWNTQNVGEPRGEHWLNTWFTGHFFSTAQLYQTPPWDLLIYYAPHPGCTLTLAPANENPQGPSRLVASCYAWQGEVTPGTQLQFAHVLLPHAPVRDASALASSIRVLADELNWTAICVADGKDCGLAFLNPEGARREVETGSAGVLVTDARAGYLDHRGRAAGKVLVVDGTLLTLNGKPLLRSGKRQVFENTGG